MQTDYFTMVANEGPSEKMLEPAGCNVCTASLEKLIKMEHAWQLWAKFVDCFSRFQDWLQAAEVTIALTKSSQVLYADAKGELKKCEVLQRQVQESLWKLESLNRQYRELCQINGIGLQDRLRAMVQECNERWDRLQKQAHAIHKRLKYFVTQREEFECEREIIEVWLIELDLKLTDVEHFSSRNTLQKIKLLQPLHQDVQLNADRVDGLLVFGEQLIQRSEPLDAECLEEELQILSCYCHEVFSRVFRFRRRLVSMRLVFEDEWQSDKESDQESDCFSDSSLEQGEEEESESFYMDSNESHQHPPKQDRIRHRTSSSKGGSLDLEWDPSVDVGGSTSHDEDDSFHSAITGIFPFEEPQQRRRRRPRTRRRINPELHAMPGSTKSYNDINSGTVPDGDIKDLRCDSGLRLTQGEDQPQEVKDQEVKMNGNCCQAERPTFDPEHVETWLGQTRPQTRLEVPQKWETDHWLPPTPDQPSFPREYETNTNGNYCSQQHGTDHHLYQPKSTSRLRQRPVMKERRRFSQGVVFTIEKRGELPVPPAFCETSTPFRKRSFLVWLKILAFVSILFALLFITGICVLYILDSTCALANRRAWSRHFMLTYVNGPPPI